MTFVRPILAGAALVLVLAPLGAPAATARVPHVAEVWSRPALAGDTGVVYATIVAAPHDRDRLLRVSSPVATSAEIHESSHVGVIVNEQHLSISMRPKAVPPMDGMEMHEVAGLDVPPGGRATLSPGRYHVMLIGLRHALVAGERFPVVFTFARAGRVAATSTVRR